MCACERVCPYNSGFKGWFHFPLLQQDPVDLSEEGVGLDGLLTALVHHAAQTFGWVLCHELHRNTHHTLDFKLHCPETSDLKMPSCIYILTVTMTTAGRRVQ